MDEDNNETQPEPVSFKAGMSKMTKDINHAIEKNYAMF